MISTQKRIKEIFVSSVSVPIVTSGLSHLVYDVRVSLLSVKYMNLMFIIS